MSIAAEPRDQRFTSKQAAAFLGVRDHLLHDWRRTGVGPPYVRMVGRVYYSRRELEEWLDQNRGP